MKHSVTIKNLAKAILFLLLTSFTAQAQEEAPSFWDKVRFGGGLGFNAGNGFLAFNASPTAIYQFNEYVSVGPSLIYSYQSNNNFKSSLYGGSVLALVNPIRAVQLSFELEQLRVNQRLELAGFEDEVNNSWNTAFFVGGGYNTGNVVMGVRYNLLFNNSDDVYIEAWAPFIRVFF